MSSPTAGLPYSKVDFLSRWMPSSTRSGVILNPGPDLVESLRYTSPSSTPRPPPLEPYEGDPCTSDFAPLLASTDSSCLAVHDLSRLPGGDRPGSDSHRTSHGEAHSLAEMSNDSQDAPMRMKLEEMRRSQQQMQEQLKADHLRKLLCLQKKRQRLLGMINTSHLCTEGAEHEASSPRQNQYSPAVNCLVNPRQKETLTGLQSGVEMQDKEDGTRADATEKQLDGSSSRQSEDTAFTHNNSRENDSVPKDRPIMAGKQTFEQLLEEQLRLEEQRLKSGRQHQKPNGGDSPPNKSTFLRQGQGLSRFANNCKSSFHKEDTITDSKAPTQAKVVSHSKSGPTFIQRGDKKASQRLPVQRNTATLNKENRPSGTTSQPQDLRFERNAAQRKVLGCHQRPNTDRNKDVFITRPGKQAQHSQLAMTKQVAAEQSPRLESPDGRAVARVPREPFVEKLESMGLGEFELLEQAAEELSFSSTSSFVTKVLQMDQQNRKLLGVAGPDQRRFSSTPIKSPPTREQRRSPGDGGSVVVKKSKVRFYDGEDSTSTAGGEIQEPEVFDSPHVSPSGLPSCFAVPSEPAYDRCSCQEEDGASEDDGESDDVISSINSSLTEDKDAPPVQIVFNDEDTWSDLDDTAVSAADLVSTGAANQEPEAPPSELMMTLFPSLKPKTQNATLPPPPTEDRKTDKEAGLCVHPTQVREMVAQVEMEIERFQKKNVALAKLRQEIEKNQKSLRMECEAFEKQRTEHLAHFEDYKKEETRKLQRERKLFEKYATTVRATPNRKEQTEIQALKEQLSSLQEELRKKESRWSCTHTRLRQQIDSLSQEKLELKDQVCTWELLHLRH
ncbi:centromere protein J-like [Dunckerocampus dactyliophorus]|uniref:centromere protein J-like n=1 Tax=Dunckerocampus dactyliophorus TaxID=161453 RepID=UPI002405A208|nr:centromere protein J-like [Dunckerocampus dactyliophorus]